MHKLFRGKKYRFGVETIVSIYLRNYQLVLGEDLESYTGRQAFFNDENPCNVYFILRRPKVTVDPGSVKINGNSARFHLHIHGRDKIGVVQMGCEFPKAESKLGFRTEHPYNMMLFHDKKNALLLARPSTLIDSSMVIDNVRVNELDYEVLYIGQSYGRSGKRTAVDRLSAHPTLQKIYAHALTQFPESDIWVMLTSFSQQSLLFAAGSALIKVKPNDRKIEAKKLENFFQHDGLELTERQMINLTEAALIRYFEPAYNLNFKDNFPNSSHTSYSNCYKLDIRAINIEVGTQSMVRKLYTKKTGRKSHHSKTFQFSSDTDRINFLDLTKEMNADSIKY